MKKMSNLVSVIIPTFNRAKTLKRAIDSVFSQTYKDWEIIVVDNSSLDDTMMVLQQYNKDKVKIITVKNNGVIGYSRNKGIQNAKGEIIAFLDSDDWWDCLKLEKCVDSMKKNNADIVYHDCYLVSSRSKSKSKSKSKTRCRKLNKNVLSDLIINGNTLVTSSVLVKKNSLVSAGFFTDKYNHVGWEDYHLWIKLAKQSKKFVQLKGIYGFCWSGDDNFDNPERVLLNLIQIEKYFANEFSGKFNLHDIWWLRYTKGKAHLNLGNFNEAKFFFSTIVFNRSPLIYKLKSVYYKYIAIPFI